MQDRPAEGVPRLNVGHSVQKLLGLRALVEVVGPGSLPRTDFKARRVIDDRAVFQDLNAQIREGSSR